jgi:alpha-tubulin N-acetyltransferase 1
MLANEKVHPRKLAYDRPSSKLKGFLSKHYGLSSYVQQNNNFIVFDDYFTELASTSQKQSGMRSSSEAPSQGF